MKKPVSVLSVNVSEKKGTIKKPVEQIQLTSLGVSGDAHSGSWHRQVSLLGIESIRKFEAQAGRSINYGEFAENITTEGIELWKTHPLDLLTCRDVELEVTQIGKECHGTSCNIFKEVGNCVMPKEGIFARVIKPGNLRAGDVLQYSPKTFNVLIITLSDRAFINEYEDRSGPRIAELLGEFFNETGRDSMVVNKLIPDDPDQLRNLLVNAKNDQVDYIFTTGGTGIGPRDFTPDVVKPMLDKEIPGIMEGIRMKYGMEKPAALLSRSVAGTMGKSLVFTLPGSVKAVNEYMAEISKSLLHMTHMLHGLDAH